MGTPADPNSIDVTASLDQAPTPADPNRYLNALCNAIGRQLQRLHGRPMTRVREDFGVSDTTLKVETTLGFAPSGGIWVSNSLFTYTSVTSAAFVGVESADHLERTAVIPARTEVSPHLATIPPI